METGLLSRTLPIRPQHTGETGCAPLLKSKSKRLLVLDALNRNFADTLTDLMPQNAIHIRAFIELIFISRCLERIGDLAKNIAEDTI